MIRHLVIFAIAFAIGILIAVILRTGSHNPYEGHAGHPAPGAASAAPATAYDAADPHAGHSAGTTPPAAEAHRGHDAAVPMDMALPAAEHAEHLHDHAAAPSAPFAGVAANAICAVCGMPVDPTLGTIAYKGKLIGFGCKTCPAKFRADPAKYGEAALKNQIAE